MQVLRKELWHAASASFAFGASQIFSPKYFQSTIGCSVDAEPTDTDTEGVYAGWVVT